MAFLLFVTFTALFLVGCSDDPPSTENLEKTVEVDPESVWTDPVVNESLSQTVVVPEKPGGAYAQVCAACHGPSGEGNEQLQSPSIAGLPAWYIEEQFRKFRTGERGIHQDDIPGQQMRAIAVSLTEEQIKDAAKVVSKLPIILTEAPDPGADLVKGRYLFANECMECHRYNGKAGRPSAPPRWASG
ncbi:MAG: c-type cytochrome [Verrucomicrobiota bacterium]